jgi:hypothetical protein
VRKKSSTDEDETMEMRGGKRKITQHGRGERKERGEWMKLN